MIHMPTGDGRLIALDAISGEPRTDFGDSGFGTVNLLQDIPRLDLLSMQLSDAHDQPDAPDFAGIVSQVGNNSPGIMCNGVLILDPVCTMVRYYRPRRLAMFVALILLPASCYGPSTPCLARVSMVSTVGSKTAGK